MDHLGLDDFKYLSGAHQVEQLLYCRSGIHEAHHAIPVARQIADRNQSAQTGATHDGRPGQINFDDPVSIQGSANLLLKAIAVCGGQL